MLLRNLQIVGGNHTSDIQIADGKIRSINGPAGNAEKHPVIHFDNAIAFPGLINSHDHLDFNLFPQLGNGLYANYVDWSHDIHKRHKEVINNVLKIPQQLRVKWGIYKNLLNGITTVVNHGKHLSIKDNSLITVFQEYCPLHSVRLEKYWKYKLNSPLSGSGKPYVVHVGEGVDYSSHREIDTLVRWNVFKRELIGVHGIAMNEQQAANFKALVWCPDSNYFLIGETASINRLKNSTDIVFGTDSTLSASWNLWKHLRLARDERAVSDAELYNMMTTTAADVWQMWGCGRLEKDYDADIVVAMGSEGEGYDAFYALNPEDMLLIVYKGEIRLFDVTLMDQLQNMPGIKDNFSKITIKGSSKYIYGNLPELMKQIESYYPGVSFPCQSSA